MPGSGNSIQYKTVYDPSIYSDVKMTQLANEAGREASYLFSQGIPPSLKSGNYIVDAGGIKWEVPIQNFKDGIFNNRYIPTAYPHITQK
ncbi:hypothetical protein [Iodobacter fluviatilis]|uniref:Uncharacterized protein n=1 Tax=Iodobacter fluviatilis TaxID=537 RepID=A0A7G3GDM8_9NEIS|nr:hypothetical protein [Iodobacter fluviatilis]QBC45219.1 hypothetical protein C1H71_17890 [Iodobacter fluviatilis]